MLQREVADRLVAGPGGREYGVLSILIGHSATRRDRAEAPGGRVPAAAEGAVGAGATALSRRPTRPSATSTLFQGLVQAVFTRRRKTLANALLAFPPAVAATPARILDAAGIDGVRRPETLSIAEFARLADAARSAAELTLCVVHRRPGAVL